MTVVNVNEIINDVLALTEYEDLDAEHCGGD